MPGELPPDLADELLAAVREICRADGAVPRAESRAIEALARRLAVASDPEAEFFRRSSPRELARKVAEILARQDPASRLDADAIGERLAAMASDTAGADGDFSYDEREALSAFMSALERIPRP